MLFNALLFIKIGFLEIRVIDLIDMLIVAIILYQLYRLIRGSLAYNIFIGLLIVFLASFVFRALDMQMVSQLFGQFTGIGMLALLIVFQPEVRKFLLYLGRGSSLRNSVLWNRLNLKNFDMNLAEEEDIAEILEALQQMAQERVGALIVFPKTSKLQFFANTGIELNADISGELIQSIFKKNSPLHDGAVILAHGKIMAAKCILPVSENPDLPSHLGLRHRSAVGITEHSDAISIVVSEESGRISYTENGHIYQDIPIEDLINVIRKAIWEETNQ